MFTMSENHALIPHTGTIYIEKRDDADEAERKTLIVDNGERTNAERFLGYEVQELTLSGPGTSAWNSQSFWSYGGVLVETTGAPYEYYDQWGGLHRCETITIP